jgi:hypothetical protein
VGIIVGVIALIIAIFVTIRRCKIAKENKSKQISTPELKLTDPTVTGFNPNLYVRETKPKETAKISLPPHPSLPTQNN